MLNEINSDNPVEEVEASNNKEDNTLSLIHISEPTRPY